MMKEKINDTEPGIKQIEREIERGCDNAKKYFWLFVVFFAAGLIVRNVMHDFFSAGIDSWKADPELNNFRYMWNTLMYVIKPLLVLCAALLTFTPAASADVNSDMNQFFNKLGFASNTTQPGVWQGQAAG
uniref:hypothetical protein n=1 Tax=Escherichia coli TaxID=562 RepID=UPI001F4A1660